MISRSAVTLLVAFFFLVDVSRGTEQQCVGEQCPAYVTSDADKAAGDPNCPDREHIIRCAGAYLDANENGKLDRVELEDAIDKLPWYGRGIIKILGSVDKMMKKCDVDKDDAISMDFDMKHNTETCLATCFKRRAFKKSFFPDCAL